MRPEIYLIFHYLSDPRVVLLDEPTAGIDLDTRGKVWELIKTEKMNRVIVLATRDTKDLIIFEYWRVTALVRHWIWTWSIVLDTECVLFLRFEGMDGWIVMTLLLHANHFPSNT